jgi:hypothetical protein
MLRIGRSRGALGRALQAAWLSWAALTVTLLTPGFAAATVAWRDSPEGDLSTAVHAMADDGSGAHVVVGRARGFELSPDGRWIAFEARRGVLVRSTAPDAPAARMLRKNATIAATAWAPDGRTLALGAGRHVEVVSLHGKVQASFAVGATPGQVVGGIGFAPDGRRLVVTAYPAAADHYSARLIVISAHGRGRRTLALRKIHAFHPQWVGSDLYVEAGFYDEAPFAGNTTELHEYRVPADLSAPPVQLDDDSAGPREQADAAATAKAQALGVARPYEPEARG